MSYTLCFTPSGSELRFTGRVTLDQLTRARAAAVAHAYEGGRRFALVELAHVIDFDLTSAEVRGIAARAGEPARTNGAPADRLEIAVVAPAGVVYGLAWMWETLAEPRPVHTAVFRSRAMALTWLAAQGIPAAELPPEPVR